MVIDFVNRQTWIQTLWKGLVLWVALMIFLCGVSVGQNKNDVALLRLAFGIGGAVGGIGIMKAIDRKEA